jgi:hypothetical protein
MTLEVRIPLTARARIVALTFAAVVMPLPAMADGFFFSTGLPDGRIATTSQPSSSPKGETETGDDFVLAQQTSITSATFTGLFTGLNSSTASATDVVVEIYRVFPADSDVSRTSGPPTFSTPNVPTRVNSPSDVELLGRDSAEGELNFTTAGCFHGEQQRFPWRDKSEIRGGWFCYRRGGGIRGDLHLADHPRPRSVLLRPAG